MALNFLQRFFGTGTTQSSLPYFGPTMTNWAGTQSRDPSALASIRRCVSILADGVASAQIAILKRLPSGGKQLLAEHPSAGALRLMRYTDVELIVSDALFSGNGFGIIENGRIHPVSAHRVSVALDASGQPWYEVAFDTDKRLFPANRIVHLKYRADPSSPHVGISPLKACNASLAALISSYVLHERLSENQSSPGMILSTESVMTKAQIQTLREIWDQQAGGFRSGGTVILTSGLEPKASLQSISQKDADLIQSLRFSVEEASRIFGVPPSLLGYSAHTSFATASEERRSFMASTLRPLMLRFGDALGFALLTQEERTEGVTVEFDSSDFGAGNELAQTITALVNGGIFSPNEARNRLGLADIADGDTLRVPANTMPSASWQNYFNGTKENG
jgi:HK97 family phage portal protein